MNKILLLLALLISAATLYAQENQESDTLAIERYKGNVTYVRFNSDTRQKRPLEEETAILKKLLKLSDNDHLKLIRSREVNGVIHNKYDQYYKGVRVENSQYVTHSIAGGIESMNGSFTTIPEMDVTPSVTESQSLDVALNAVNAKVYAWEDSSFMRNARAAGQLTDLEPKGELVLYQPGSDAGDSLLLVWKFAISAAEPLSSDYVYIDAKTGALIKKVSRLCHTNAPGTVQTKYAGTRSITGDFTGTNYRLYENRNGTIIRTMNLVGGTTPVDFTDNDNNWLTSEHPGDQQAYDLHWNAEQVYDYFRNTFSRNSMNGAGGQLVLNAHFLGDPFNAVFNPSNGQFYFGDGGNDNGVIMNPLTSLDITAHEMGHSISYSEVNFPIGTTEAAAINEGLSDIWGAVVESVYLPAKQKWTMAEDAGGYLIRHMDNPNAEARPDTYNGAFFCTSNCNSHKNMSIISHWFWRLVNGGTGTNDLGTSFSVSGISMADAARIVYKAITDYMVAGETFSMARVSTISAATEIFGPLSCQVKAVTDAWVAVGVGSAYTMNPSISLSTPGICTSGTATILPGATGGTVTWAVSPSGIVTPTSGSGGAITMTRVGTVSGSATLTATVVSCGTTYTRSKTIVTGLPLAIGTLARTENVGNNCGWDLYVYLPAGAAEVQKSTDGGSTWINCPKTWDAGVSNYRCRVDVNVEGPATVSYNLRSINSCGNATPVTKTITLVRRSANCQARITENNSEVLTVDSTELQNIPTLMVYPNPTHGVVTIAPDHRNATGKKATISGNKLNIYNSNGALIKSRKVNMGTSTITVDMKGYPAGIYFIETTDGKSKTLHKVVLQD
jgi:Zn-dependent metalloprotease